MSESHPQEQPAMDLRTRVRQTIASLSGLPTAVGVAIKLFELGRSATAEPADYARIIGSDASLSSRILSVANSPFFGVRNRITRPLVAVNLLGLSTVRTLAISFCLAGLHNELRLNHEESRLFWAASLNKAVAARRLALMTDPSIAEEAYIAGLFQDVALPLMYACAREEVGGLLENRGLSTEQRLAKECALFGADHAELGRLIATKLDLPAIYCDMITSHHIAPRLGSKVSSVLAEANYAAALFPHRQDQWNARDVETLKSVLASRPEPVELSAFLQTVGDEYQTLIAYFDHGRSSESKINEAVANASREAAADAVKLVTSVSAMIGEVASAGRVVSELRSQQTQLEQAALRDPLTGALNREGFFREGSAALAHATRCNAPVALLFLDLDRFKSINDTCGHAVGDDALSLVVETARICVRNTDHVARLGGDEFAVLLVDCPDSNARQVADRMRQLISARTVSGMHGEQVGLSVSTGMIYIPAGSTPPTLDELLDMADRLMYDAKRKGGDCLCVEAKAGTPRMRTAS